MQKPTLIAKIDLMAGCGCGLAKRAQELIDRGYVAPGPKTSPRITAAAISLNTGYDRILKEIKRRHKGNFVREAKKAEKAEARFDLFEPAALADEIESINKSLPTRSGGPMRPGYLRSASELREAYRSEPDIGCRYHWSMWFGCFMQHRNDGRNRLVGYLQLRRYGQLAMYSTLLGHGEHLSNGVMPFLHLGVLGRTLLAFDDIKWLMYAGWHDGGKGLQLWKKKAGFDPVMLVHK